jgi:hypothetical protein
MVGAPVHDCAVHAQPACALHAFADAYVAQPVGTPLQLPDTESQMHPCTDPHDTTSPKYEQGEGDPLHAYCDWHPGEAWHASPERDVHALGAPTQRVPPSPGGPPASPTRAASAPASSVDEDVVHALAIATSASGIARGRAVIAPS